MTSAEFLNFLSSLMQSLDHELASQRDAAPVPSAATAEPSATLLTAEAVPLTRAQGAELLRQAFNPVTRSR